MNSEHYFRTRFSHSDRREVLWKTLCDAYFNDQVRPTDHVLELGAGYGYFINNIRARERTAVDRWEGLKAEAAAGVKVKVSDVWDLGDIEDRSVDYVFASNLFEHLTQDEFAKTLAEVRRVLKPSGTLNILQPNYKKAYREYFDDYTHVAVYSDVSLVDFLNANGFQVLLCHPGFLPLTIKSRLPTWPILIRIYLMLPWKPLGKQMLVRAQPRS